LVLSRGHSENGEPHTAHLIIDSEAGNAAPNKAVFKVKNQWHILIIAYYLVIRFEALAKELDRYAVWVVFPCPCQIIYDKPDLLPYHP
jgi:hypothetical protein